MNTLTRTDDNPADPQVISPYFRRCAEVDAAVRLEAALRGLPPDPLAA
jgi:hypothetical protein